MKIASVTENGNTISQHFGRAPLYVVVTAEDGKVLSKETRAKAGHHDFHQAETKADECGCGVHGHGEGVDAKHRTMADSIADCSVVMAGGMGWGAYESMKSRGIEPIVTDVGNIDEAVSLYLKGELPNLMERLH